MSFNTNRGGVGGWTLVSETVVAVRIATVDISFTGSYDDYRVEIFNLLPVTDNITFQCRLSQAGVFLASAGDYLFHTESAGAAWGIARSAAGGDSEIKLTAIVDSTLLVGNLAAEGVRVFNVEITDVRQTTRKKPLEARGSHGLGDGTVGFTQTSGYVRANNAAIDGIRFFFLTDDVASGTFRLFGRNR